VPRYVGHLGTRVYIARGIPFSNGDPVPVYPDALELFTDNVSGSRTPIFRYVRKGYQPNSLADAVLIPLPSDRLVEPWLGTATIIPLTATKEPAPGDMATMWGFPTSAADWPTRSQLRGPVIGLSGAGAALLLLDVHAVPGYSGAPVFGADGGFLGMQIGDTNTNVHHAQVLTPGILRLAEAHPGGFLLPGPFENY
jgi:hypothetical protein